MPGSRVMGCGGSSTGAEDSGLPVLEQLLHPAAGH